jgi:hypothetical protein
MASGFLMSLDTTLHVHGAASPLLAPAPGPAGGGAQEDELLLAVALAALDGEPGLPPEHGPRGASLLAVRLGGRRCGCGRPPGHPGDHGQNISAGTESRSSSSSAGAGTATDLPDEGHGLAVPDGRELPHLARTEELQRAQLAQRPPVGPVGSEGEVVATVADDLRGEQVYRKARSGVVVGGAHGCWPLCASEDPAWLLG